MKKLLVVLMALCFICLAFAGCGKETENPSLNVGSSTPASSSPSPVTVEQAGEIAMENAGTNSRFVTGYSAQEDVELGQKTYEIEFFSDGHHYEYEIDAATGQIISFDKD